MQGILQNFSVFRIGVPVNRDFINYASQNIINDYNNIFSSWVEFCKFFHIRLRFL